ncbi:hypothetical protein [uncultured Campylobacter sp.]|uniref:hypothetical protein n=1 Tax=uncultured Campylobacter sp. TaxID=218934 RepID=UPI00260D10CC|nr:hypothetical protein [uncultured Campylobacter sp.]
MQDIVSQARKNGIISTGIDLFLAAVPVVFIMIGFLSFDRPRIFDDDMTNYIASGILIAFICASMFFRLRALDKIEALSDTKAAALYRNCIVICVCTTVCMYFYQSHFREITRILIFLAAAAYVIVSWFRINFSLARISGVSTFRTYVWLCVIFFVLNILCNATVIALALSERQIDLGSALTITAILFKLLLPFAALIITSIVHLLAWSKIEKISTEV